MNASAAKHAPTVMVLVAAGVCAWPYLGGGTSSAPSPAATKAKAAAKAEKVVELPAALLSPTPVPKPFHNPFQDPEQHRAEAKAKIVNAVTALFARAKTKDAARRPGGGRPGAAANAAAARSATNTKRESANAGPIDPRVGLVLNATTVVDGRGFAVINGKSYGVGETVPLAGTDRPCRLVEVRLNEVQLQYDGKRWPLDYDAGATGRAGATAALGNTAFALNGDENQSSTASPQDAKPRRGASRRRAGAGH